MSRTYKEGSPPRLLSSSEKQLQRRDDEAWKCRATTEALDVGYNAGGRAAVYACGASKRTKCYQGRSYARRRSIGETRIRVDPTPPFSGPTELLSAAPWRRQIEKMAAVFRARF